MTSTKDLTYEKKENELLAYKTSIFSINYEGLIEINDMLRSMKEIIGIQKTIPDKRQFLLSIYNRFNDGVRNKLGITLSEFTDGVNAYQTVIAPNKNDQPDLKVEAIKVTALLLSNCEKYLSK